MKSVARMAASVAVAAASVGLGLDLKKRVEIMAGHVAQSGPEFERSVKAKNEGSPQYAFLFGGEGAEYYQALLQSHSVGVNRPLASGQAKELLMLLKKWPEPVYPPALGADHAQQLSDIIGGLEQVASRDAIRAGREWVEANHASTSAICGGLMIRMRSLTTCDHRMHVLFLVHDVLLAESSKGEFFRPITLAFKPYLPWIMRPAYQLAQNPGSPTDEPQKVLKFLAIWQERSILSVGESTEMRLLTTAKELPTTCASLRTAGSTPQQPVGAGLLQQVQRQVQAQQVQRSQRTSQVVVPPPPPAPPTVAAPAHSPPGPPPAQQAASQPYGQAPASAALMPAGVTAIQTLAAGRAALTPESVPVGVMASMLKQVSRRGKDLHTAFLPYRPLDPLYTPQAPPSTGPMSARCIDRLSEYYERVADLIKEPAATIPAVADEVSVAIPPPAEFSAAGVATPCPIQEPVPAQSVEPTWKASPEQARCRSRSPGRQADETNVKCTKRAVEPVD